MLLTMYFNYDLDTLYLDIPPEVRLPFCYSNKQFRLTD